MKYYRVAFKLDVMADDVDDAVGRAFEQLPKFGGGDLDVECEEIDPPPPSPRLHTGTTPYS